METLAIQQFIWKAWDWDLSKIVGCLGLWIVYGAWTRFRSSRRAFIFVSGVIILFLALGSPLDALSDDYLFSAHMLQHFVLLMIVPPLLILGLPETGVRQLLSFAWVSRLERKLANPVPAWILANVILWVWHLPRIYDIATENEGIHIFQHLTFLVSSTIYWWPVLAPEPASRLDARMGMIYLFTAALSNMALGILLTFSSEPLYSAYFSPEDPWKILPILRHGLHLDPLADQKLGGILMWVLGSIVFLAVLLKEFGRWVQEPEEEFS